MRHLYSGRKLGVSPSHRTAMLRSLTLNLIENERIKTTPARAKELRKYADRVITLAKKGDLHSRRQMVKLLGSTRTNGQTNRVRLALDHVYKKLVPRFKDRNGGYTQILRLSPRPGDNAELCLMRYLPEPEKKKKASAGGKKGKSAGKGKAAKAPADKPAKAEAKEVKAKAKGQSEKADGVPQDKPVKAKKKE